MPRSKSKTLLVVEDEKDIQELIRYNFEKEGYKIVVRGDGESAVAAAESVKPALVLLDVMLPKMGGLDVCRELRKQSDVPILFLTAKKSEVDRILGLKLGADDYVTKPFSIGELIARVEAVLRRSSRGAKRSAKTEVRLGDLEIDLERHQVWVKRKAVRLAPKEFEFLKLLFEANGTVLSRDALLEAIWGYDKSMEIDARTVDQHIARLRRKLKAEGKRVVTVTNVGYRLHLDS